MKKYNVWLAPWPDKIHVIENAKNSREAKKRFVAIIYGGWDATGYDKRTFFANIRVKSTPCQPQHR